MRRLMIATGLLTALSLPAAAGQIGDQLAQRLYDGTLDEIAEETHELCYQFDTEACFARGLHELITSYEGLSQAMYRHGATDPSMPVMGMLLGMGGFEDEAAPANPNPEPLTYESLRDILDAFARGMSGASIYFQMADMEGDFVIPIDPFKVRVDLDGNGTAGEAETLAFFLTSLRNRDEAILFEQPAPSGKVKTKPDAAVEDTTIGFDNADAVWLAGYSTVAAVPVELILAHDFSDFFNAYLHLVFPKAGLPMEGHNPRGDSFLGEGSDAFFADLIAGIHTMNFPVEDPDRLAGVLEKLKLITSLSRRNWEMILAETDDDRELVPSPTQTSMIPGMTVTQDTVDAWLATLDIVDQVLNGELLVPHWRFEQGFDLKAWFTTATRTDLVLLISGSAALPYIKPGPIADVQSFAEANEAFGAEWLNYAFWFN
ncbi:MAG: hypothetical protein P0Y65_04120 [Candidatus Devosia phytovorans]|uniref:Uncharacterized protein n=1 Tax=Candidatus Devosia phytovorans TaxID=3121372 RepID=A0AAJ6B166_9HYPH|nr:hypothetical protein [Devosia sp.]WEK05451.1 MAG: hypothetical protein P0Y65_04120 [Devosia sp.]